MRRKGKDGSQNKRPHLKVQKYEKKRKGWKSKQKTTLESADRTKGSPKRRKHDT